ncbi:MAG: T9SS type A sorting domain-containing protein [Chitinophagales bacterium]
MKHVKMWLAAVFLTALAYPALADTEPDNNSPAGADALVLNDTVTGTTTAGDNDFYAISTSADGNIHLHSSSDIYYVYLDLYDADGTTLLGSASNYSNADLTVNGLAAGDYFAVVRSGYAGNYSFTVDEAVNPVTNDAELNDAPGTALILPENGSVDGHISYRRNGGTYDNNDYYALTTTTDGNIQLSITTTSTYSYIALYDSNGTTLLTGSSNYAGTFSLISNGLAAGDYFARVYTLTNTYYGGYTLSNTVITDPYTQDPEPNNTAGTATPIDENSSASGHIYYRINGGSYDASDYYAFTTSTDGNIQVSITTNCGYSYISLLDNDGTTVLGSASNYAGTFSFTSNGMAAGDYFIRVYTTAAGYYGGYTVSNTVITDAFDQDEEPNNIPANAVAMGENDSISGHLYYRFNGGSYDADDYYVFSSSADGDIGISINTTCGYSYIYLYDIDGTTLLGSTSNYAGNFGFTANGLAAGDYIIRVHTTAAGYYGGYTVKNTVYPQAEANDTEDNDTPGTAGSMDMNGSVTGHIYFRNNGADYDADDYYLLNTTADGNIQVSISTDAYYSYIYLYDNNGTTLLGSTANYAGDFSFTANGLAAGSYYIRVHTNTPAYYGGYTLSNTLIEPLPANDAENNGSIATALNMPTNSSATGHLYYRYNGGTFDTSDYYHIHISVDGTLSLSCETNAYYSYFYLLNSAGSEITHVNNYAGTLNIGPVALAAGDYYVRYYTNVPSYFGAYTLTNSYCPDTLIITALGETTFCEGESVTLATEDHYSAYLWNDGSVTETNVVTLTDEYYLTIDNGMGCARTSNSISVESTPLPVAIIDADGATEFCDGGSVTLSVPVTPDTYLWSTGETTPTISVSSTGDYDVFLTKNGCSAISDPIHIEVHANPVANIAADGDTEFCDGGSVTLTASPSGTYLWSDTSTDAMLTVSSSGTFTVEVTDGNGCSDISDPIDITVNPNPVADIIADGPTTFCSGGSVHLTASGGDSYLWNTGATTAGIDATASGDYSATVFTAAGCSAVTSSISVTVEICTELTISADGDTEFCAGGSVLLTSSEATGNLWSTGETTQSILVSSSGTYSCENAGNTSNSIEVIVHPNPDATVTAGGDLTFCDGGSVTLSAPAGYDGYAWNTGATTSEIIVTTSGDYSVEVTDGMCSTLSDNTHVTVNSIPVISISSDATAICYEGSVELSASTGAANVQWQINNVDIPGATELTYSATEKGMYTCVASNGTCSTTSNTITLKYPSKIPVPTRHHRPVRRTANGFPMVPGAAYQWYKGNMLLAGETSNTLTIAYPGVYHVQITKDGCTRISVICKASADCRLGEETGSMIVYPNPASTSVQVQIASSFTGTVLLHITDITGRVIYSETQAVQNGENTYSIRCAEWSAGVYTLSALLPDGSNSQQKLVIEK